MSGLWARVKCGLLISTCKHLRGSAQFGAHSQRAADQLEIRVAADEGCETQALDLRGSIFKF